MLREKNDSFCLKFLQIHYPHSITEVHTHLPQRVLNYNLKWINFLVRKKTTIVLFDLLRHKHLIIGQIFFAKKLQITRLKIVIREQNMFSIFVSLLCRVLLLFNKI